MLFFCTSGSVHYKSLCFYNFPGEPDRTMVCAGPMVKHAEDLAPLTKILFHTEMEEVAAAAKRLQLDKTVDVKDIKFYYVEEPLDPRISPVSSEVKAAIKKAVDYVSEASGRPAVKIQLSGFRHCFTLWRYWMTKEGERFASLLGNNEVYQRAFLRSKYICRVCKFNCVKRELVVSEATLS